MPFALLMVSNLALGSDPAPLQSDIMSMIGLNKVCV